MPLAAILATGLLLAWPHARIVPSMHAVTIWQSTQPQDQPSNSSPQRSPSPPAEQQETRDQSIAPPPAATAPCPEKSQTGSTTKPDCKPAQPAGPKAGKHGRTHKTVAPAGATAETGPTKTVVRNGSAADPTVDLSPLSQQQASHQIDSINQLLAASDENLKEISGRQFNASQQDTVKQVQSYLQQAEAAKKDGDLQRAHNLAVKANLLSAELVGH
jgi:cytoskeletal protein RodZ